MRSDLNRETLEPMPEPTPTRIVSGGWTCELRVWTEAEWEALPPHGRPAQHTHVPGLGWVGAVPVEGRN